jgi:hypothetical protein
MHETRQFAEIYGSLQKEVEFKYDNEVYQAILSVFSVLPLGATVDNKFFCAQSGIPESLMTVQEINERVDRFVEDIPNDSVLAELMSWEPIPDFGQRPEVTFTRSDEDEIGFFGMSGLRNFLSANKLKLLVRGKDLKASGYGHHVLGEKILIVTLSSCVQDMYEEEPNLVHTRGKVMTQAAVALYTVGEGGEETGQACLDTRSREDSDSASSSISKEEEAKGLTIRQWRHSKPPPFLVPNFLSIPINDAQLQWEENNSRGREKERRVYSLGPGPMEEEEGNYSPEYSEYEEGEERDSWEESWEYWEGEEEEEEGGGRRRGRASFGAGWMVNVFQPAALGFASPRGTTSDSQLLRNQDFVRDRRVVGTRSSAF